MAMKPKEKAGRLIELHHSIALAENAMEKCVVKPDSEFSNYRWDWEVNHQLGKALREVKALAEAEGVELTPEAGMATDENLSEECKVCGKPIPKDRLEEEPTTIANQTTCSEKCAAKQY